METETLNNLVEMQKGKKPKVLTEEPTKESKPYILIESFDGNYKQFTEDATCKLCEKEDVLIVWDGARSGLSAIGLEGYIGSTVMALKPKKDKVNPKYLFYFVNSKFEEFNKNTRGTGIPHLKKETFEKLELPLPPLPVQEKIVAKLDAFFEKYRGMKKENEKAKENIDNVVNNSFYFLLDSVEAENKPLNEICEINPKKSEAKDLDDSLEVSFVPMKAVDENKGAIIDQEIKKLKQVKKGYTYFKEKDVIFAKITPCMENKKSAITINLKNGVGFGSTEFHVLRAKENILPEFLYFLIRQDKFISEAKRKMTGTVGQFRVPSTFLESYQIKAPGKEKQKEIIEKMKIVNAKKQLIAEEQKKIEVALTSLPKAVLAKAFSGALVS